jgi:hypothetical protein
MGTGGGHHGLLITREISVGVKVNVQRGRGVTNPAKSAPMNTTTKSSTSEKPD